jgi:hypothetical protein
VTGSESCQLPTVKGIVHDGRGIGVTHGDVESLIVIGGDHLRRQRIVARTRDGDLYSKRDFTALARPGRVDLRDLA